MFLSPMRKRNANAEPAIAENPSAKAKGRLNARTEKNLRICAEICGDGDGVVAATRLHSYCFYSGKQAFFRWFWKFHFLGSFFYRKNIAFSFLG
jgi:hypothetical protein